MYIDVCEYVYTFLYYWRVYLSPFIAEPNLQFQPYTHTIIHINPCKHGRNIHIPCRTQDPQYCKAVVLTTEPPCCAYIPCVCFLFYFYFLLYYSLWPYFAVSLRILCNGRQMQCEAALTLQLQGSAAPLGAQRDFMQPLFKNVTAQFRADCCNLFHSAAGK